MFMLFVWCVDAGNVGMTFTSGYSEAVVEVFGFQFLIRNLCKTTYILLTDPESKLCCYCKRDGEGEKLILHYKIWLRF